MSTKSELQSKARQMMIDGDSFDKIMAETDLRLKDLKKIRKEINSHF